MERTFAIIKPDAVAKGYTGKILSRVIEEGFTIKAMKMIKMTKEIAQGFYHVHMERPFFNDLTNFMCEGPVVVMILEADGAIAKWRKVMGATDPAEAEAGTIRKEFAENKERNATHGSDAPDTAAFEMSYFFNAMEIMV